MNPNTVTAILVTATRLYGKFASKFISWVVNGSGPVADQQRKVLAQRGGDRVVKRAYAKWESLRK